MNHLKTEWKIFLYNYTQAPTRLKVFIYFCLLTVLFSLLAIIVFPKYIKEAIIPIMGWNMGNLYLFSLIVAVSAMLKNGDSYPVSPFYILQFSLFSFILFGAYDFYTYTGGFDDNPYLYHSPWRPVWTMGVPLFWMAVLLSPRVRSYLQFQSSGYSERLDELRTQSSRTATEPEN